MSAVFEKAESLDRLEDDHAFIAEAKRMDAAMTKGQVKTGKSRT